MAAHVRTDARSLPLWQRLRLGCRLGSGGGRFRGRLPVADLSAEAAGAGAADGSAENRGAVSTRDRQASHKRASQKMLAAKIPDHRAAPFQIVGTRSAGDRRFDSSQARLHDREPRMGWQSGGPRRASIGNRKTQRPAPAGSKNSAVRSLCGMANARPGGLLCDLTEGARQSRAQRSASPYWLFHSSCSIGRGAAALELHDGRRVVLDDGRRTGGGDPRRARLAGRSRRGDAGADRAVESAAQRHRHADGGRSPPASPRGRGRCCSAATSSRHCTACR